ncbi:hypothetical protein LMG16407_03878 [Pandoraea apista]|nr:hypothetical protein LMG16407_03878 [Pandoraea apista]
MPLMMNPTSSMAFFMAWSRRSACREQMPWPGGRVTGCSWHQAALRQAEQSMSHLKREDLFKIASFCQRPATINESTDRLKFSLSPCPV